MKKPRLTMEDRLKIETMLKERMSVYAIAKALSRPVTTITREIKARAEESSKDAPHRVTNRCTRKMECERRHVCAHCLYDGSRKCSLCRECNSNCGSFVEQKCERLDRPPFVCNGCAGEHRCVLRKRHCRHERAQEEYKTLLSESRAGANVTEDELLAWGALLESLSAKGQSIHAAVVNNPDKFTVSVKTLYRYVNGGLLKTMRRDHLPRAMSLRPRSASSRRRTGICSPSLTVQAGCGIALRSRTP